MIAGPLESGFLSPNTDAEALTY